MRITRPICAIPNVCCGATPPSITSRIPSTCATSPRAPRATTFPTSASISGACAPFRSHARLQWPIPCSAAGCVFVSIRSARTRRSTTPPRPRKRSHTSPSRAITRCRSRAVGSRPNSPIKTPPARATITRDHIHVCDLSDVKEAGGNVIALAHQPAAGSGIVAVDPVLGRIAFADAPGAEVLASFHYGFTIAIGGGEYERGDPAVPVVPVQQVQDGAALQPALDAVQNGGTVEVLDSHRYVETPGITVHAGKTVVLRAVNGARPLLAASGDNVLRLDADATLIIDGWVIAGVSLIVPPFADTQPRRLILRDCTLVPGPRTKGDGSPPQADDAGLGVHHAFTRIEMERCITAPLHIATNTEISLNACIVDATTQDGIAYRGPGADPLAPGGALTIESCTLVGKVHTHELSLASDCIFAAALAVPDTWKAPLWAERRQQGCVRFSFVPEGSRTPRRYHCQPEGGDHDTRPHFTSLRYGDPGYCQLRQNTSDKIRRGAHDESEMGVLHDLYQPQRETNLRVRLEEYLRFGRAAGLIYGS